MCGGTTSALAAMAATSGLSPRVRGNLVGDGDPVGVEGSIPACAGEPRTGLGRLRRRWVYPRVCGGTYLGVLQTRRRQGLSPRVRGNLQLIALDQTYWGSIPACAGEPRVPVAGRNRARVYPRVCGGTGRALPMPRLQVGLSPRVRGNPSGHPFHRFHDGSIPACAGEPPPPARSCSRERVYPRVCGGTERGAQEIGHVEGLSPRVRGNRRDEHSSASRRGSIPACAGEPEPQPVPVGARLGLSPRVRGNLAMWFADDLLVGSIPACAGEPCRKGCSGTRRRVYPRVCGGTLPLK